MKPHVVVALLGFLAAACASAPAGAPGTPVRGAAAAVETKGRYGPESGEATVGVIPDAVVRDEARNRNIPLSIDYPTRATAAPVIVFSHAVGASERDYAAYASHWASHGYVVVRVGHADAVRGLVRETGDVTPATSAEWVRRAHDRAADLKVVIDAIATFDQRYPELAGKIDPAKIGVAGHAFGAMTSMLAGGLKTFPDGASSADPRVKVVIAMSPPGPGERRGLTAESFATLKVPTLFLTGTRDIGGDQTETPEWRALGFDAAAPGDKWLITLTGAGRNMFSGLLMDESVTYRRPDDPFVPQTTYPGDTRDRELDPRRRSQGEWSASARSLLANARAVTLAFFDVYLRNDPAGREFLTSLTTRSWGGAVRQR